MSKLYLSIKIIFKYDYILKINFTIHNLICYKITLIPNFCQTWTRTKILASRGRCPTIRRFGRLILKFCFYVQNFYLLRNARATLRIQINWQQSRLHFTTIFYHNFGRSAITHTFHPILIKNKIAK